MEEVAAPFYVQPPILALASLNFALKNLKIGQEILLKVEFPV